MHLSRLSLSVFAFLSTFSYGYAEPVFLIQLGSHKTPTEAEAHWRSVKGQFADKLKGLDYQAFEVTLPPAGNKVYRLQAGPFPGRLDALSVCNDMQNAGRDCFVIESAMFQPKQIDPVVTQVQKPAPAPVAPQRVVEALPAELPAANVNLAKPLVAERAPQALAVPAQVARAVPQPVAAPVVNTAAFEDVALPWEVAQNTAPEVVKSPPVQMNVVRNGTPVVQNATPAAIRNVAPVATAAPVAAAPARVATVPQNVAAAPATNDDFLDRPEVYPLPATSGVVSAAPRPVVAQPAANMVRTAPAAAPRPVVAPAPAPARVAQPVRNYPQSSLAPRSLAVPASMQPRIQQNIQRSSQPVVLASAPRSPANVGQGEVVVSEAIPVPLSDENAANRGAAPASTEPGLSGLKAPGWNATPSRNFLQKTLWAKIHYFGSKQAALAHWEDLRQRYPNLTQKLRVRITKPYQQNNRLDRVSLQVGPFLADRDITALCSVAAKLPLKCGVQRDIGASTTAGVARYRSDSPYMDRRSSERLAPRSTHTQYWVQLGSYPSKQEAYRNWNQMRYKHSSFAKMAPQISQPVFSSSAQNIYRLRTGPYAVRYSADSICNQLKANGSTCIVITE